MKMKLSLVLLLTIGVFISWHIYVSRMNSNLIGKSKSEILSLFGTPDLGFSFCDYCSPPPGASQKERNLFREQTLSESWFYLIFTVHFNANNKVMNVTIGYE